MYRDPVPNPHGRKPVLLVGEYGRLTSTDDYELRPRPDGRNRVHQRFLCACGEEVWSVPHRVRSGNTNSCGCLHRERASAANLRHGDSRGSRLYRIWKAMHFRCRNVGASNYEWYGGKGIIVCEEWSDYARFREWALDSGYAEDLEIDRIDASGNYGPDNCHWITKAENVRRSRLPE